MSKRRDRGTEKEMDKEGRKRREKRKVEQRETKGRKATPHEFTFLAMSLVVYTVELLSSSSKLSDLWVFSAETDSSCFV